MAMDTRTKPGDTRNTLMTLLAAFGIALLGYLAYVTYERTGNSLVQAEDAARTGNTGTDNAANR
jgi:hypothetical protein